jgi:signal transduction histidine kinase
VRVTYEKPGTVVTVRPDVAIQAYRVLQEALSNVARHAGTGEAIVRLAFRNGALHLEVEDHGPGLPAESASRGLGLVAMRERAELVGGTVTWTRPPAGGTLVSLVVPL